MKINNKKQKTIKKKWFIIDASEKFLGKISTKIAIYLKGKHKIKYTPHINNGDFVIIINAKKIFISGKKNKDKFYYHHTGYIGGIKKISFKDLSSKHPEEIIKIAVKGMLPKNILGYKMLKNLKVYPKERHPHKSQNPTILNI